MLRRLSRPILIALLPLALLAAPASSGAPVELPEGAVVMPDGTIAVPLGAATPAEYTDVIHQKVLAAGEKGLAYDSINDQEVAVATDFLFIRPGAWMWSPSWCTMNFIYGTAGNYEIGSAGHCNQQGQDVVLVVYPGVFANIGKTRAHENAGPGNDWSLTTVKSSFQQYVDANVADIWGPQGSWSGEFRILESKPAKHVGHGLGIGTGGTPRAGVVIGQIGTVGSCECVIAPGDSGSPLLVITPDAPLGKAFMVITHLSIGGSATGLGTVMDGVPATVKSGDINPLPPA